MDLSQLNELETGCFKELFANIFEHHPEAAQYVSLQRPFKDRCQVVESFCTYMDQLPMEVKKQVLANHPMLGTKKAMTKESTNEQKSAGLRTLAETEAEQLEECNSRYYQKFGFPYIKCVLETTKDAILLDIKKSCENDENAEILRGIDEVKKIAKHRILSLIS